MSLMGSVSDLVSDGADSQDPKDGSFTSKTRRERNSGECSHKVIEKRRRDRINSCLAELGNLLPMSTNNGKQGSGKLEKAEILEMTVEHLKKLQAAAEATQATKEIKKEGGPPKESEAGQGENTEKPGMTAAQNTNAENASNGEISEKKYTGGYRDCTRDVLNFLVNVESMDLQRPSFQRLRAHMQHQLQLLVPGIGGVHHFQEARHRKRKHSAANQFRGSSSSSSSSSNDERSGSSKRPKTDKDKHSSWSQAYKGRERTNGSDKESSDSAVCIEDTSSEGSTGMSAEKDPPLTDETAAGAHSRTVHSPPHSPPGLLDGLLGSLPQAVPIPLRSSFVPTPFSTPTYALHPSGTHYIPVALHPGVQFPPYTPSMPYGVLPNAGVPVMGLPSMPPGVMGMPIQPNPYGIPLIPQNHTGFPAYPAYPAAVPEFGLNRQPHVKVESSTSGEDAASGSESNSDSRLSGNGNSNNSSSPNCLSDSA